MNATNIIQYPNRRPPPRRHQHAIGQVVRVMGIPGRIIAYAGISWTGEPLYYVQTATRFIYRNVVEVLIETPTTRTNIA